jgi:glycosyltransferase involved in cell wall biosynthesis
MATALDVFFGIVVSCYLVLKHRIKIVHARSYVSSVIALSLKKLLGVKFIFDMRGFWADERVDGGIWPQDSRLYHVAKWFERQFLLNADVVVSLTHTAVNDIRAFSYMQGIQQKFVVIPTCANLQLFHPPLISVAHHPDDFVLGYVGTVGTWYLFDETLRTFMALLKIKSGARLLIINRNEHDFIRGRMLALGVDASKVELKSAAHHEVVQEIHRMDAGVFYIKPAFSKRASAPTKFGELLGCGVPCISNSGVGDTESILEGENVGVVLRVFDDEAHAQGVQALLKLVADADTKLRCVDVANQYFSLEQGVKAYEQIYRELC